MSSIAWARAANDVVHAALHDRTPFAFEKVKIELTFDTLTLYFQDKTTFTLVIEPCFLMEAHVADLGSGEERVLKRWFVIRSATPKA